MHCTYSQTFNRQIRLWSFYWNCIIYIPFVFSFFLLTFLMSYVHNVPPSHMAGIRANRDVVTGLSGNTVAYLE